MRRFFRRKKIVEYCSRAERYISRHFDDSSKPTNEIPSSKPSNEIPPSQDNQSKYSLRQEDQRDIRYSLRGGYEAARELRDRYDSEVIDREINRRLQSRNMAGLNAVLDKAVDQTFVERLIALIDVKGVRDSSVYKAAQIDRRLFSKIMSDSHYKPAKDTAIAIALALQLPLPQANDLLSRAGYTFSHSNKRDVVIEYFFREHIFDLTDINLVLDKIGLKPIGR